MPAPNQRDLELETQVFTLFQQGKTVNQIAKEYTELTKHYPDHKKRVEKVNNWHKKFKKIIVLELSKRTTQNIEQSIQQDDEKGNTIQSDNQSPPPVASSPDENNNYTFSLTVPQIWSEQLKTGALAKAEHKEWIKENVLPIEKEFYLEWYKAFCQEIRERTKTKKFDADFKSLIGITLRLASELKKNPSFPSYMQESIAYLNMLKSEEGAIANGFIDKKVKAIDIKDSAKEENAMSLVRLKGLF